jgi:hypothetical protein
MPDAETPADSGSLRDVAANRAQPEAFPDPMPRPPLIRVRFL